MNELKPCPFCGGEAKIDTLKLDLTSYSKVIPIVLCQCGALTIGYDEKDAIKAWNRRTE